MDREDEFQTTTMAKVYADQGHFQKAAEIYRQLLENEPGKTDLVHALEQVEMKIKDSKKNKENLIPLFSKWIELLLRYNRVNHLKKIKNKL